MLRYICFMAALLMGATEAANSAEPQKVPVTVEYSGTDAAGQQLSFYLREQIRKSATFQEVYDEKGAVFVIPLVTIDPLNTGNITTYSYSILIENNAGFNYFVTSYTGVCGISQLESCSKQLFAALGSQLEQIRAAILSRSVAQNDLTTSQ